MKETPLVAMSGTSRVVFIVALLALKGSGAVFGVAAAPAQKVPDRYTAETPLFHSSTSSDERVSQIGRLHRASLLSPDRFVFTDLSLSWLVFVDTNDGGVATAGREGEGPHEFKLPILVGRSGDGRVVVWDAIHRRVALVNADGVFTEAPEFDRSVFARMTIQVAAGYADGTVVITDDGFPIGLPSERRREPGAFALCTGWTTPRGSPDGPGHSPCPGSVIVCWSERGTSLMWNTWSSGRSRDTDGSAPATSAESRTEAVA